MSDRFVIDPERIAALIDGRLSPKEREQLMLELSDSPEGLEILAQASQLVDELDEAKPAPAAAAPMPKSWRRPAMWFAAAAAVVVVSVGVIERSLTRGLPGPDVTVAMLQPASSGGPAMTAIDLWPATRGAGDGVSARANAVRIGALLSDLEMRSATPGDSIAAQLPAKIVSLLESMPGGPVAARAFQSPVLLANAAIRHDAMRQAELVAGATYVRASAWLEAARVAIGRRDSTFFSRNARSSRRALESVAREVPSAMPVVEQLTQALSARPINWDAAATSSSQLLTELGR